MGYRGWHGSFWPQPKAQLTGAKGTSGPVGKGPLPGSCTEVLKSPRIPALGLSTFLRNVTQKPRCPEPWDGVHRTHWGHVAVTLTVILSAGTSQRTLGQRNPK